MEVLILGCDVGVFVSEFLLAKDSCLMACQMKELTSYNICYIFGILNIYSSGCS